jgi:hypothetical protein
VERAPGGTPDALASLVPSSGVSIQESRARAARGLEWAGIGAFAVLWTCVGVRLAPAALTAPGRTVLAIALAYLAADLLGGLVHWGVDTWGSPDLPIVGPAMIGPFREHHVDPLAITRHDFLQANGNTALITLPVLGLALWLVPGKDGAGSLFWSAFLGALASWTLLSNQFHKWAHVAEPPPVVRLLQRFRVILPPDHHARHHTRRVESHWCITTGWMNGPLERSGLLRFLEGRIVRSTGAVPWRGEQPTPGSSRATRAPSSALPAR